VLFAFYSMPMYVSVMTFIRKYTWLSWGEFDSV